MRKLRLDLDSLDVQSFETDDGAGMLGTVHGASGVQLPSYCAFLCGPSTNYGCGFTDYETCGGYHPSCDESCYGTCFSCVDENGQGC
jgi:hypothetical protein